MKKALITGITGQDGSYLAEFLLEKGYEVHGIVRRASISNTARIDHLIEKNAITLHDGDLSDSSGLIRLVGEIKPDEIYNLAAQSHVQVSFDAPEYSGDVDALGVLRVLEAVRVCGLTKTCKVYQASTSELYGKVEEVPQRETSPFHPYSPYAVAKPNKKAPACPKWLEPEAKKEWRRLAKQMEAIGILTEVDMAAFAGYCQAYARWKEAEEFITQHGTIVKTPSGYWQQVPQVSIAQTYLKIMNKFAEQFGLTPSSRSRIIASDGGPADVADEMENLLGGGGS